ncbi:MAG: hypothetical protein HYU64_14745 [Armatimonadetes bacterium]|nr:hypothetical protein [Armatimonadota bacterium]
MKLSSGTDAGGSATSRVKWVLLKSPGHPDLASDLNKFMAPHAIRAALSANSYWRKGVRDLGVLRGGAKALVFLTAQSMDEMEIADLIRARALALLAVSKVLDPVPPLREESLLAHALGYHGHAYKLASSFPKEDPLRLFVSNKYRALGKVAARKGSDPASRYLYLQSMAQQKRERDWGNWVGRFYAKEGSAVLPVLKTGLELCKFETTVAMGLLATEVLQQELKQVGHSSSMGMNRDDLRKSLASPPPEMLSRFEKALEKATFPADGPFLDKEMLKAYYRGYFYSALRAIGIHFLDQLASAEAAREFQAGLGHGEPGFARDFETWYRHLTEPRATDLEDDFASLKSLGGLPLARSFEAYEEFHSAGDHEMLKTAKDYFRRMDTRPDHRWQAGGVAGQQLLDPALLEKTYGSFVTCQSPINVAGQAWYADFTGNRKGLEALLGDQDLNSWDGIQILKFLRKYKEVKSDSIQRQYERFIALDPDNWRLVANSVDHLHSIANHEKAREQIKRWLARNDESAGFPYIFARTQLARMYWFDGKYQEGLKAVERVAESWQGGAMQFYALLLNAVGRTSEAERVALAVLQRYPTSPGYLALAAEIYWRQGMHREAAHLLNTWQHPLGEVDWKTDVAPQFVKIFKDRQWDGTAAIEALQAEKFNPKQFWWALSPIAEEASEAGCHQFAFETQSRIRAPGISQIGIWADAYVYYKRWKGKDAALQWMRKQLETCPESDRNVLAVFAEDVEKRELLWEVLPENPKGHGSDAVWLARAISALRSGSTRDRSWQKIHGYFKKHSDTDAEVMGRYFLGMAGEQEMAGRIKNPQDQAQVLYFLGLKAHLDGRYGDASEWYRASMETGLTMDPCQQLATRQLNQWIAEEKSLDWLLANRK